MLTLYGDLDSGNVYKVRLILAHRGVIYRRVDTTQNRGEPQSAEFRALNPIGKIPTLVFDDGRMLSESGPFSTISPAIRHCFRKTPGSRRMCCAGCSSSSTATNPISR
jgi:hypothetical protein